MQLISDTNSMSLTQMHMYDVMSCLFLFSMSGILFWFLIMNGGHDQEIDFLCLKGNGICIK